MRVYNPKDTGSVVQYKGTRYELRRRWFFWAKWVAVGNAKGDEPQMFPAIVNYWLDKENNRIEV